MSERAGPSAWLAYALFRVVSAILQVFPIDANLQTARFLARLWIRSEHEDRLAGRARIRIARFWRGFRPRHRSRAIEHLRAAYADSMSQQQIEDTADRAMEHLAMFAIEVICVPRLISRWTWRRYIKLVGFEPVVELLLEGNGAILVTGHYGNWELLGHLIACLGFDITAVMRPLDNVYLNRYLVRTRRTHGLELLDKKGASGSAEDVLARGGLLGLIADQDAGRKGLFADFFGRPASCYKMVGLLAIKAEAPIVIGYARRVGNRFRYEVGMERIIRPEEWASQKDPLRWITQAYTTAIESGARCDPSQYHWIHRRWKTRPRNEHVVQSSSPTRRDMPALQSSLEPTLTDVDRRQ